MISDIKLFDKWSFDGLIVSDIGLARYININPILIPRTNGYYHNTSFYKTKLNIVERILNRLQVCGHKGKKHKFSTGHNTGKASNHLAIIKEVFKNLERKTKINPIQVLITTIVNCCPREEVLTIERAGAKYAQAVDTSPQRRVDLAIRHLCQGAAQKSFNKKKSIINCLTEEILTAYNKESVSFAYSKRVEIEKMAVAAK